MNLLNELLTLSESRKWSVKDLTINGKKMSYNDASVKWEGNFYCDQEDLTSLEGSPSEIRDDFNCSHNNLTSLKFAPYKVGGYFSCNNNNLTSIEGMPKSVGAFISCYSNNLTSLKNIHTIVKRLNGGFYARGNPIKSHVLGLLLIPGCIKVELDNKEVEKILNKYLPNTRGNRGLLDCQSELLDANLDEYAEL